MNVLKTLEELRTYHRELGRAIKAFENLARRRTPESVAGRARRSASTRQRMADAQRKRRAAHRKVKSALPAAKSTAQTKSQ